MAKRSKNTKNAKIEEPKAVPEDGAQAYAAGFSAADCPFPEGTEEFDAWNEQWDNAAELATEKTTQETQNEEGSDEEGSEKAGVEVDEAAGEDGAAEGLEDDEPIDK